MPETSIKSTFDNKSEEMVDQRIKNTLERMRKLEKNATKEKIKNSKAKRKRVENAETTRKKERRAKLVSKKNNKSKER